MNKLSLITILFLLILPEAEAISFGSLLKKDFAQIKANELAKFEILFWNVEEKPYQVQLKVEKAPEDWLVMIQPKEFTLSSSTGEEYISLPYSEKPAKAFPVNVFVKPENSKAGKYQVLIKARAGLPGEGISFFQERDFKLNIEIEGEKNQEFENKTLIEQKPLSSIEKITEQAPSAFSYIFTIIGILVISLIIYKYA
jgi:uncharacterized membrane protein